MPNFMDPKGVSQILELTGSSYRPPEIVKLKEEIESRTRVAKLKMSASGEIDEEEIAKIVQLKLQLDNLYVLWAENKL